jgi:hypothetical protein
MAVSPSHRRANVGSLNCLLGKVHRVPQEICDPQLLSISRKALLKLGYVDKEDTTYRLTEMGKEKIFGTNAE